MIHRRALLLATFSLTVFLGGSLAHAIDPRFELDPRMLQQKLPPVTPPVSPAKESAPPRSGTGETSYTVKRGDSLVKILRRDFGKSRSDARALVPEIERRNRLGKAKRLEAGRQIIIPLPVKSVKVAARTVRSRKRSAPKTLEKKTIGHRLALFKGSAETGNDGVESARLVWEKLLPGQHLSNDALSIKGDNYTLDLSPDRFPILPAADGGKILVEAGGKLSPLVKSLIQGHDPGTRIVTYTPNNRKRFFANLLSAAGFYSVEEDFTVAFGSDPKLTVTTDFKVENDANSALQHDIYLFNSEPRSGSIPAVLADYLAGQGFKVIDFYPSGQRERPMAGSSIDVINDKEPSALADKVMSALGLGYEQEREIDLLSMREGGVALRVKADRYFEKNGERYVVSFFKGDPENYTLLRLLETERYHVIMLTPGEDFRSVAGKILSQLRLPGRYEMQKLIASSDMPYTIQMSGFMLNASDKRGKLFLTGSSPDRLIGELLELNGYTIHDSHDAVVRK